VGAGIAAVICIKSILINHKITYDSVIKRHLLPVGPFLNRQGEYMSFHCCVESLKSPMMLLCKGTSALIASLFEGQWQFPIMYPHSSVTVFSTIVSMSTFASKIYTVKGFISAGLKMCSNMRNWSTCANKLW